MKLVLFDIDGTILTSDGAAIRAVNRAFFNIYGIEHAVDGIEAAGRTDPAIVGDMFTRNLGREHEAHELERLFEEYVKELEAELSGSDGLMIFPGIPELLSELSVRDDIVLGIATGNIEPGARLKLAHSGLNSYFPFGGFGSDSPRREGLIRIAIERGQSYLPPGVEYEEVIVVGDTHHDIIGGRAAGARVVAVATGTNSMSELREHDPEHLFADFSNVRSVLEVF